MTKTPVWALPYPALSDPADITGVDGVDDLAMRLETVLSQIRAAGSIPGEVKLWPGGALPTQATYGHWVWADGAVYVSATYPLAVANIATAWRTAHGQTDPGAGNFRVPDLRGLSPAGLDQMPGGARANRTTRAVAITIAARTGEEYHSITLAESAAHAHALAADSHGHPANDPWHKHRINTNVGTTGGSQAVPHIDNAGPVGPANGYDVELVPTGVTVTPAASGVSLVSVGGGGAHENVPPTVYVPWIVKLDD